jgi:hypothetical protein
MRTTFFVACLALSVMVPTTQVAAQSTQDKAIAQDIGGKLKQSGQLKDYRIGVKYKDGVAALSGTVTNREQLVTAVRLTQGMPGVDHVVNNLTIAGNNAQGNSKLATQANFTAAGQRTNVATRTSYQQPGNQQMGTGMQQPGRGFNPQQQGPPQMGMNQGRPMMSPQQQQMMMQQRQMGPMGPRPQRPGPQQYGNAQFQGPRGNMPRPMGQQQVQQAMAQQAQMQQAMMAQQGGMGGPMGGQQMGGPMGGPMGGVDPASCNCGPGGMGGGYGGGYGDPAAMGSIPGGMGGAVSGDNAQMPGYAWPSYASYPNYAALTYPKQYSPTAWPYIGPFYPYPQVPLGWRKVCLEWDDGWWFLDFNDCGSNH